MSKSILFSSLVFVMLFSSCEKKVSNKEFNEGAITYNVSFPFNQNDILINLYPEEMVFEFKEDQIYASMQSLGGMVASSFIIDNKSRQFTQQLRAFKDKYVLDLDEAGTMDMLSKMPEMRLYPTGETDSIAGYLCQKTIAHFTNDSVPPIELYHTEEIKISSPNWYNQFNECPDVLLGYEIEQYGMRMKLRATSVVPAEVNEESFMPEEGFVSVGFEEMRSNIRNLLNQFQEKETNRTTLSPASDD